jgi:hypothetical protein
MVKDATIAKERDEALPFSLGPMLFVERRKLADIYPALVRSENRSENPTMWSHPLTAEKIVARCTGNASGCIGVAFM